MPTRLVVLASLAVACAVHAQPAPSPAADPLSLPLPRPASKGAYQWGIEALRFDLAWSITRGRAHIAFPDIGPIADHEDLRSGIDGPLRLHLSEVVPDPAVASRYHSMMTIGVAAARGANGHGIAGACPYCSVSIHNGRNRQGGLADALESGAAVVNLSAGSASAGSCAAGNYTFQQDCAFHTRAEERDVVFVVIAGNSAARYTGLPGGSPTVMVVAGLQPDGAFWTEGYETANRGSDYGAGIRLVAPSRDVLTTHPVGGVYINPSLRCGDRVDSLQGAGPSLGAEYAGYGDCHGTSFSGPWVSALAGLMRSANPLLTAAEVRRIIDETATRPVAGPAGSGLTFYIPDAEAALRKAIGTGLRNRTTPMFSLFAPGAGAHFFTTSPQAAVAAAAGELGMRPLTVRPVYESFGDEIAGYTHFAGRICAAGNCRRVPARAGFDVFSTENSVDGRALVPLYRLSLACSDADCTPHRSFTYATSDADVRALQQHGWAFDMIEGYVYSPQETVPGAQRLCLGHDAQRRDRILYAAASCDRAQLANAAGETTGGSYSQGATLGFLPMAKVPENHTGLWWNPAESGWGVNFSHQGDLVFGTLFTYAADGTPMWLVMSAGRREGEADSYSGELYRARGFPLTATSPAPVALTEVGKMTVSFDGADMASLTYDVSGVQVAKKVTRMVFGARAADCRDAFGERTSLANYQDLWFDPREPGWGLNVTHQGALVFATLFTYDDAGMDLWYVMSSGERQPDGSYLGRLYRTRGPAFDAVPWIPLAAGDLTDVGAMRLRFVDGANGTMHVALEGRPEVQKAISRMIFSTPASGCRG
jgi:hypothetical protein